MTSCGNTIGDLCESSSEMTQGSILLSYVLDAVFAILCNSCECKNPRIQEWTKNQLIYDYKRRIDGNDDSILLSPDLVRSTIDVTYFWLVFERIGHHLGFANINDENRDDFYSYIEAMTRIFPEGTDSQPISIHINIDNNDNDTALAKLNDAIKHMIDSLPDMNLLNAFYSGFRNYKRELLPHIIDNILSQLDAKNDLTTEVRARVLRSTIECLNNCGYKREALTIAQNLLDLVTGAGELELADDVKGHCYNEIGNCYRNIVALQQALACYDLALDLLGRDLSDSNNRIGLRNRAIILRETHRYSEARKEFAALVPFAKHNELRGIVLSEAICLHEMGLLEQALALLEKHQALIDGRNWDNPHALEYISFLNLIRFQLGKLDEVAEFAAPLIEHGKLLNYPVAIIIGGLISLATSLNTENKIQIEAALDQAIEVAEALVGHQALPTVALLLLETIDRAALKTGRIIDSVMLNTRALESVDPIKTPKGWVLPVMLARHFYFARKDEMAKQAVELALEHIDGALWQITKNDDVLAILTPQAAFLSELVRLTLALAQSQPEFPSTLTRLVADLNASPVLSSRLRQRVTLDAVSQDILGEEERLARLLFQTPAVIVQFVELGSDIAVLLTTLNSDYKINTEIKRLGIDVGAVRSINSSLRFVIRSSDPLADKLDLRRVQHWDKFASLLNSCINDVPIEQSLLIVAGPVGETSVTLALGHRPLSFIPSISGLIAMRIQRLNRFSGLFWSLRRLFDFTVWFDNELLDEANALANLIHQGSVLANLHNIEHEAVSGKNATEERLISGLKCADIARIACHGRFVQDAEAIDLLVAANGFLPPSNLMEINSSDLHVVSWQKLADLESAPVVVFSSACDSGVAVINTVGERFGLERQLFKAGTLIYVAPLWPVPTVAIQGLVARLIDSWLDDQTRPLAVHLAELRLKTTGEGIPQLAAKALAIFGDGI